MKPNIIKAADPARPLTQRSRYFEETKSLVQRVLAQGFNIIRASNGGEPDEDFMPSGQPGDLDAFIEELTAADEADLWINKPGEKAVNWLSLVLGNSPGELLSNYSSCDALDAILDAHSAEWEAKPTPS